MSIRLYDWGPSPFCLKIRAILDHKQVAFERRNVLGKSLVDVWRRGKIGKVPALEIDGELICDSTDIAYELERRYPAPAILPPGARERGISHALEDWADESLYFVGLYLQWFDDEGKKMVPQAFGGGPLGKAIYLGYSRMIRRQIRGQGTGRKPAAHVHADLERHLDAAGSLLDGREFLIDDQPRLCDFAVMSQLVYLRRTPVGGRAIETRPAITAFLDRMRALRRSEAERAA